MRHRFGRVLLVAALLIPFSGCPGTTISLGTWLITVKHTGADSIALAFELLANGNVQKPNPVPAIADDFVMLGGSWVQNGSTFTLTETKIGEDWIYTGTVHSSTSMSGTWAQDNAPSQPLGVWAATWLP